MKFLFMAAVVAAMLGFGAAAGAGTGTFYFTYSFADGQQITGSFFGTTSNSGQSVTNISNISVALNSIYAAPVTTGGTTFGSAQLQINAWNPTLAAFDDTTPVTIYANGALNGFAISDVDVAVNSNPDYQFAYINDSTNNVYESAANNFLQTDAFSTAEGNLYQVASDSPGVATNWQLVTVPPASVTVSPLTVNPGQMATLTAMPAISGPYTYQWYSGTSGNTSNPIAGATSATFTTPALSATTTYWVLITGPGGEVEASATVTVTVNTQGTDTGAADAPLPWWALAVLGIALLWIGARRNRGLAG
jgi:hypothetical protein